MDSFPWKLRLGDVSCYTVEARDIVDTGRESDTGMRSQLKTPSGALKTRTVLEPVTTTVTLSVVTKTMQIRSWTKPQQDQKTTGHTHEEAVITFSKFLSCPDVCFSNHSKILKVKFVYKYCMDV